MKYTIVFKHGDKTREVNVEAENVHKAVYQSWTGIPRNYWLHRVTHLENENIVEDHYASSPPTEAF